MSKLVKALKKVTAADWEPLGRDETLDEGMERSELESILNKKPQMLLSEDGYPFWKVGNNWLNDDMDWGTDADVVNSVLNGDMTFLVYYKVPTDLNGVNYVKKLQDLVEEGLVEKPDWHK